jgi:hypothetical protein
MKHVIISITILISCLTVNAKTAELEFAFSTTPDSISGEMAFYNNASGEKIENFRILKSVSCKIDNDLAPYRAGLLLRDNLGREMIAWLDIPRRSGITLGWKNDAYIRQVIRFEMNRQQSGTPDPWLSLKGLVIVQDENGAGSPAHFKTIKVTYDQARYY